MPPCLAEIARAKLIRHRDRRGAHGPVLVRALRPGDALRLVDPQRETHRSVYVAGAAADWRASTIADRSIIAEV